MFVSGRWLDYDAEKVVHIERMDINDFLNTSTIKNNGLNEFLTIYLIIMIIWHLSVLNKEYKFAIIAIKIKNKILRFHQKLVKKI